MSKLGKVREQFYQAYGEKTYEVVKQTVDGYNAHQIAEDLWIPVTSVAAYKAHLTRGTYAPFVEVVPRFEGTCKF